MPVYVVSDTPTRLAAIRCADVRYLDRKATIVYYAAGDASGSGGFGILILVGFAAVVYFLMIRPQQRQRRQVQQMQSSIGVGDEIVTIGGLYGTVVEIDDETVLLEISPGVTAKYARGAIGKLSQKADAADTPDEDSAGDSGEEGSAARPDAD